MSNLIQIQSCAGLDCSIKNVQSTLYYYLNPIWLGDWDCYPRVYKNKKRDQDGNSFFVPEYLDGTFNYTTDTLFDDRVDVVSFFLASDVRNVVNDMESAEVSIIFSCLIDKIYTGTQKQDEKMKQDIRDAISEFPDSWTLNSIETGVDQVYREFSKKGLEYADMSNRHLLRFNFTVNYSYC